MSRWMRFGCTLLISLLLANRALADESIAAQIREHAGAHRLLVLGEMHGTRETPQLVQQIVESYARQGIPSQLALELPTSENDALRTYLHSTGDTAARSALRGTKYWTVESHLHDGRRSHDMLDMIEALRVLRESGNDIHVYGIDHVPLPAERAPPGTRDAAMANELRERYNALPANARLLVLIGNVHGMRSQPSMITYPPMASLLVDLDQYNVRIEARTGEFWGCRGYRRCGSQPIPPFLGASPRTDKGSDRSYDLWVWLPRFTVARLLD